MANDCVFKLKAYGKPENLQHLIACFKNEYDQGPHFWNITNFSVIDEATIKSGYFELSGTCNWSLYCTMFDGLHTYQDIANKEFKYHNGVTITDISKENNIKLELFSTEPGVGFQEHFIIDNGEIITEEVTDYAEYSYYDILDEYNSEHKIQISESDEEAMNMVSKWYTDKYGIPELYFMHPDENYIIGDDEQLFTI